jgi:DNA-binding transcriptional regulator YhcF (GntR family)
MHNPTLDSRRRFVSPRPGSGVATYLQLVRQVREALRMGVLKPGDQLPTAAQVVADLAINPNTVLKAYRGMERDGLVGA